MVFAWRMAAGPLKLKLKLMFDGDSCCIQRLHGSADACWQPPTLPTTGRVELNLLTGQRAVFPWTQTAISALTRIGRRRRPARPAC